MSDFWELFKESIIVQSLITLILICADVYLALIQVQIPDWLVQATMLILGFWFGTKVKYAEGKGIVTMMKAKEKEK